MKNKLLTLFAGILISGLPALSQEEEITDPEGTESGARKEIQRYIKENRGIIYFDRPESIVEFLLETIDYTYGGMMLGTDEDFMKDHAIIIIVVEEQKKGTNVVLTEDVVYPVWSKKNEAHVLRDAVITTTVKVENGKFIGLDGLTHRVHECKLKELEEESLDEYNDSVPPGDPSRGE
jgi:hypothetical protein